MKEDFFTTETQKTPGKIVTSVIASDHPERSNLKLEKLDFFVGLRSSRNDGQVLTLHFWRLGGLFFLLIFVLTACAETEFASHMYKSWPGNEPPQGTFKVGDAYMADGKWYRPQETYNYTETGIASWYGPGFDGRRTANGERFDKNELTAAHRTLQMPSLVRVTNLENGRSLIVRVNDRGPFARGRVIDVSQRAAQLLDFTGKGTAKVRLDVLADESRMLAMAAKRGESTRGTEVALNERRPPQAPLTQPEYEVAALRPNEPRIEGHVKNGAFFPDPVVRQSPVHPTNIYVQAGAFTDATNAHGLAGKLRSFGNVQIYPTIVGGRQFFRVRVGPVVRVGQADALLTRVVEAGYREARIIVD